MRVEQLREAWRARARARAVPIRPVMSLEPEGLVLGAGTVLVPSDAKRRLRRLRGQESRILALLSAAYGRAVPVSVLGHIDRAAKSWSAGDETLALIHLALGGLHKPEDRREAARRLFMADALMAAGVSPSTILKALDLDTTEVDGFEKVYNPAELRVPKYSGASSGEWTADESVLANLSDDAARFLGNFVRDNEVTLALGLLLIPDNKNVLAEGDVPDLPGLSYVWNQDTGRLLLTYQGQDHTRVINATLGMDGAFRDGDLIVGRFLPDHTLAIDPATVSADLADKEGPNLCPIAVKDNPGRQGAKGEKDKDYEDQIKRLFNPDDPTPRGYAYEFFNPQTGRWVKVDDCQHQTGARGEFKSEYDHLLAYPWGRNSLTKQWLAQSLNYIQVSRTFDVDWFFAERRAADFARDLFRTARGGQDRIHVFVVPRQGTVQ